LFAFDIGSWIRLDVPNNPPEAEYLLKRLRKARRHAGCYRFLNILLFVLAKFGVPALSAIVTANLFLATMNRAFLGNTTTIVLAILVGVISSVDTIVKPAEKKKMAFKTANRLAHVEETLLLTLSNSPEASIRVPAVQHASDQLKQILDDYADQGW
jgi:hypothetical protein